MKFLEDGANLLRHAVLQNALDDTAAIWMRRKSVDLTAEGINNKVQALRRHAFYAFLYDMIAILVFNALEHTIS